VHRFPTKWIVIWLAVVAAAAMVAPAQALAATAALWHMDERSGTVMHDAVGNHDGTISHVRLGQAGVHQRSVRLRPLGQVASDSP
jgi:hypothetical protein